MYIVIVGGGRTGQAFAERAIRDGHQVVIVEQKAERAQALSAQYDCLVLHADAGSREILEDEAAIGRADAVVATTRDDSVNMMVALIANQNGVGSIVSTIEDDQHIDLFEQMGVDTVESPQRLAGRFLYDSIARPKVRDFMELTNGAELQEIVVTESAELLGRSLAELVEEGTIGQNTIFVAIVRDGKVVIPKGGTELRVGDEVTVLTHADRDRDVSRFF